MLKYHIVTLLIFIPPSPPFLYPENIEEVLKSSDNADFGTFLV